MPERTNVPKAPLDLSYKVQFMNQQTASSNQNNSNAGKTVGFGMGAVNAKLVKNDNLRFVSSNREKQIRSEPEIGKQKKSNSQIRYNNRLIREKLVQQQKHHQQQMKMVGQQLEAQHSDGNAQEESFVSQNVHLPQPKNNKLQKTAKS